jgi:hypothetical protein
MDFPNSDYIEVYKRLDFTVLIVDDRGKRFTFVKDLLVKYLVYRAEKTSFDKFFKIYVEFIELFCK